MSENDRGQGNNSDENGSEPIVLPPVDRELTLFVHSRTLTSIKGLGNTYLQRLRDAGIRSLNALLLHARTRKGRQEIATEVGVSDKQVLEWAGRADIQRVLGVGPEYADLLRAAGVETVPELARRNPENLHARILEVNEAKKLVRKAPTVTQVEKWVANAGQLPRVVEY